MMQLLNNFLMGVATLHRLGALRAGGFLATLIGLVLVVFSQLLYFSSHDYYYQALIVAGIISFIALHHAVLKCSADQQYTIIITKVWAMFLLLAYIPITMHFMVFGWVLYHMLRLTGIFRKKNLVGPEGTVSSYSSIDLLYNDCLPALVANLCLHVVHFIR